MKLTPMFLGALAFTGGLIQASENSGFRPKESFDELVGMEVRNLQDEKLGTIKYLTADLHNGRIVEVVIDAGGGFLGLGGKTTAVPPRALVPDFANHVERLDISKARFEAAPKFDKSHLASATQREKVAEVNRYYGLEPWFYLDGQKIDKNSPPLELGHVEPTEYILHLPITNSQGKYIGKVETLMMDVPKGVIVHVISGNVAATPPHRVLQPRSLSWNAAKDGLILNESYVGAEDSPRFKWLDANRTAFRQETYQNRAIEKGAVQSLRQGKDYRDRDKTARILATIQADPSLSKGLRNLEVATYHAQTTLRGYADSVAIKQKAGDVAAKAGRPENVSNLIEVK